MATILVLTDSLSERAGGLSHATINLACSSASLWPSAKFVVLGMSDGTVVGNYPELNPPNLEIATVPCIRNNFFPWSSSISNFVESLQPDLVHLRGLWRQPSLVSLRWKENNPHKPLIVQTAGMLEPWAFSRNGVIKKAFYQLIEKKLLEKCDLIHATSQQESTSLELLGWNPYKVAQVEEGVFMPDVQQCFQINNSEKRNLLFLSRLHPVKGIEILLQSLSLLRPRAWTCQIAGMGSPDYVRYLENLVKELRLNDVVTFLGPLSGKSKQKAFAEADAFVLPSFSESFGIAIAEAMSWGLPIVTTTATPWEIISDQDMGWLVQPNLNSLSFALFELFQSSELELHQMGRRARTYVQQYYDWTSISHRMIACYRTLLGV